LKTFLSEGKNKISSGYEIEAFNASEVVIKISKYFKNEKKHNNINSFLFHLHFQ
jgi:hypothetical protein